MHNLFLAAAIISEVIATSFLKASKGFTAWGPSLIVILGYAAAFYFLSLAIEKIPIGVAYAIWCGAGILLITVAGTIFYKQIPDAGAIAGISLITAGVVVLQLFSKTTLH